MLLEYASAASRVLINRGVLAPALHHEPELVNLQEGQVTPTVWWQMNQNISVTGVAGQMELGNYLLGFTASLPLANLTWAGNRTCNR